MLDQETARIGEDATAGVIQPDFTIDVAVRQLSDFAVTAPAQTVLVASLQSRLAGAKAEKSPKREELALARPLVFFWRKSYVECGKRALFALACTFTLLLLPSVPFSLSGPRRTCQSAVGFCTPPAFSAVSFVGARRHKGQIEEHKQVSLTDFLVFQD